MSRRSATDMRIAKLTQGIADYATLKRQFRTLRGKSLRSYQAAALRDLVGFAAENSAFYQALYQGYDLDLFDRLPTVDKAAVTAGFDALNTAGLTRLEVEAFALEMERTGDHLRYLRAPDGRDYVIGMSSGTSGARGLVVTRRELTERLPVVFAARSGLPVRLMPWRIAFMLRVFSQAFQDINAPLVRLDYLNTMTPVDEVVAHIAEMRANVLMAPPSVMRILAGEARKMPSLKLLVSIAEVLHDDDEARIRASFGLPLIQIYQASEGVIGCSCSQGTLHINEDLVYVELLDREGRPVTEPGARAHRMLVTNLYNRTQPLIRYELNDLIELGEPCSCGGGFRTIRRVLGRSDDVLWFAKAHGGRQYVFPDLVSRWIISSSEDITDYRVEQGDDDALKVWLDVTDPGVRPRAEAEVRMAFEAQLSRYGCVVPAITFPGTVPPVAPGAKRKRFVRMAQDTDRTATNEGGAK